VELYLHSQYVLIVWCSVKRKDRDNFTFLPLHYYYYYYYYYYIISYHRFPFPWYLSWTKAAPRHSGFKFQTVALSLLCVMSRLRPFFNGKSVECFPAIVYSYFL
jgi:hypothetical protein